MVPDLTAATGATPPRWIRRHPIAAFAGGAYSISWMVWSPLWVAALLGRAAALPSWWHYVGSVGPITSALIVSAILEGAAGPRRLLGRLAAWRGNVVWIAVAAIVPLAALAAASMADRALGGYGVDWSRVGRTYELPWLTGVTAFLFHALTFGVGEETGWRAFALPRLQARRSALVATVLLTLIWAGWHLPAFLYRPGYMGLDVGGALGWLLSLFGGALLLTWLFNSSRGSTLVLVAFHGSINLAFVWDDAPPRVPAILGMMLMVWAVGVLAVAGPRTMSHRLEVVRE